jgi:hypothetical protein
LRGWLLLLRFCLRHGCDCDERKDTHADGFHGWAP